METIILDVREIGEFQAQHIPGSIFLPLIQLELQMSIPRQTQIAIGTLVFMFALLSFQGMNHFSQAGMLMGAGLFLAGLTGSCLMAQFIGLMPWNKSLKCVK